MNGRARRWAGAVLVSLGLAGCGALGQPPAPLAGDLLGAPTTLNLDGQVMRLTAAPQLRRGTNRFSVRVEVEASAPASRVLGQAGGQSQGRPQSKAAPRPLKVTALYVVTGAGLWHSPGLNDATQTPGCGGRVCAWGSGAADGFTAGEAVSVIARLRDARGQTHWLRDARSVRVAALPVIR